jgi:hypothetical protein
MMKRFFLFSLLILMLSANQVEAQVKPLSKEKQKKELRKKKEKQIEKQRKAEEGLNIQDKATKKRIKAAKKKSDKLNRSKRRKR